MNNLDHQGGDAYHHSIGRTHEAEPIRSVDTLSSGVSERASFGAGVTPPPPLLEGLARGDKPKGRVIRTLKPSERVHFYHDGQPLGYIELIRVPHGTRVKVGLVFDRDIDIMREDK